MVVEVDGSARRSWADVIRASLRLDSARFDALTAPADSTTYTTTLHRGSVVLPGATVEVFHTGPGPFAPEARRALNDERVKTRVCYCSLYGDCWVAGARVEPEPVRACPDDPEREFGSG